MSKFWILEGNRTWFCSRPVFFLGLCLGHRCGAMALRRIRQVFDPSLRSDLLSARRAPDASNDRDRPGPWDHGTMGPWDHGTMGPWPDPLSPHEIWGVLQEFFQSSTPTTVSPIICFIMFYPMNSRIADEDYHLGVKWQLTHL